MFAIHVSKSPTTIDSNILILFINSHIHRIAFTKSKHLHKCEESVEENSPCQVEARTPVFGAWVRCSALCGIPSFYKRKYFVRHRRLRHRRHSHNVDNGNKSGRRTKINKSQIQIRVSATKCLLHTLRTCYCLPRVWNFCTEQSVISRLIHITGF